MTDMAAGRTNIFPMELSIESPERVANWRPLVHWLLVIPHLVVLYALGVVAGFAWIGAFFTVLFTKQIPPGITNFIIMVHRYEWRIMTYMLWLREPYPAFEFEMEAADPGTDPAHFSLEPPGELNRWLPLVKWLMLIPQLFVLVFVMIAFYVVWAVAFFAVLFTGRWPEGMRRFAVGVMRWIMRVSIYSYLLTDVYPPFALD